MNSPAVLLTAHGSPDELSELPEFLKSIRRGRPAPPELISEERRRYETIGGRSPLGAITRSLAEKLSAELALPVHVAMRLWHPFPDAVLAQLSGVDTLVSLPLAPYSTHVYNTSVREAAARVQPAMRVIETPAWNEEPEYLHALEGTLYRALRDADPRAAVVFTAHSLPTPIIAAGDPYADLVGATVRTLVGRVCTPRGATWRLAYQSQGASAGPWLGPDLAETFRALSHEGVEHVVIAPVGFVTDHIEVLYDLDVEAVALARDAGLTLSRTETLNASEPLVRTLRTLVQRALK